jgi:predicted NBD/HSP70 family sugar kinase
MKIRMATSSARDFLMIQGLAPVFRLTPAERRVLETVWRRGPIARIDIAKETDLTGASITRLTRDLEQRGLICDTIQRDGSRGQPTRPVSLANRGAFAFGVNFSHSSIDVGLIDLAGNLLTHERAPLARALPSTLAQHTREALERHLARMGVPPDRVVGVGFSVPGDFRRETGRLNAHIFFPDLQDVDLQAEIAPHIPIPVLIENDAASAAAGERVHGQGMAYRSFMFVHIGHGVGGGLVLNGRLFRGEHGNAGMIGTMWPLKRPRPSGQDLLEHLQKSGVPVTDFTDMENLDPGHPVLCEWLERAGPQLAEGIYLAARLLDPQAIILGGRLPPAILALLFEHIKLNEKFRREPMLPRPAFLTSKLGSYAGVVGAASMCFFKAFFEPM